MRAIEREIRVYRTPVGREPYTDWLRELKSDKARRAVLQRVARLALGNAGDWRPIRGAAGGIREMRVFIETGYRVYYAEDGPTVVILLCGGAKFSQERDTGKAIEYWNDYQRRK